MLSEEEKIIIIQLQSNRDKLKENFTYTRMGKRWLSEDIDKAINLIEKQQKKIEEYEILLKKQEQLEQEKENLIKQGWLNE